MNAGKKLLWAVIGFALAIVLACGACGPLMVLSTMTVAGTDMSTPVGGGPAVGLIRVDGVILSGQAPSNPFGTQSTGAFSEQIVDELKQADADAEVKAIVIRVSSPGGSVVASSEIHEQIVAMSKPVVISMGEMAASGGYYIAAPADVIFANPDTLTGSIGVISQFLDLSELLAEYGVSATIIKSGEYKDQGSMFRPMTEAEQVQWQGIIDEAYDRFVQIVADGRQMPVDEVVELANGSVYTGQQAMELGLVDEMGNLPDAIQRAAELGGIEGEPRIQDYFAPANWLESLFSVMTPSDPVSELIGMLKVGQGPTLQYLYLVP